MAEGLKESEMSQMVQMMGWCKHYTPRVRVQGEEQNLEEKSGEGFRYVEFEVSMGIQTKRAC